ncbi:hypothetical protein MRX96_028627 [Rhipicephalus microplus]
MLAVDRGRHACSNGDERANHGANPGGSRGVGGIPGTGDDRDDCETASLLPPRRPGVMDARRAEMLLPRVALSPCHCV